jgi:hypothetical protein
MFVGSALSDHSSLTQAQVAIYSLHDGQLFETLRTATPGVVVAWRNLTQPSPACVATPPTVLWRDKGGQPLRVFCTATDGTLVARPLALGTRLPLPWEVHGGTGSPTVFTSPGASVEFNVTVPGAVAIPPGAVPPVIVELEPEGITGDLVLPVPAGFLKQSLFVGATDGTLWERTLIAGVFSWVSHGSPPGTCVSGEPATDPAAVPPTSPLRVFATAFSGAVVERVIGGPAGITWVNHGRPTVGGVPVNASRYLVAVFDPGTGAMHVFAEAGDALHELRVATLGDPGTWREIGAPAATRAGETTRVESSPGGANIVLDPASGPFVRFFVVASRQVVTTARSASFWDVVQTVLSFITFGLVPTPQGTDSRIVSAPTEEMWECLGNVRAGNTGFATNLGLPSRTPLLRTDWYRLAKPAGAVPDRSLVYSSSVAAEGTAPESLDEWSTSPVGSTPLGLMPAGISTPCVSAGTTLSTACAGTGPRTFGIGIGS